MMWGRDGMGDNGDGEHGLINRAPITYGAFLRYWGAIMWGGEHGLVNHAPTLYVLFYGIRRFLRYKRILSVPLDGRNLLPAFTNTEIWSCPDRWM